MKLTEDPAEYDDRPMIEEMLDMEDDETADDGGRLESYRFALRAYVLAPLRIALGDWRAVFGFSVIGFYLFMAIFWAPMYSIAYRNTAPALIKPFNGEFKQFPFGIEQFSVAGWTYTGVWHYPLGTDSFGQPILQQIVNASPRMLELVLAGAVVSVGLAVVIGTTAGYKGGFVDRVLMSVTDVVLTIPGLPLIVLLAAIIQPDDPFLLGMLLAIDNWPGLARSLRSQVLTIRGESYVEASRAMGVSSAGILGADIIPQLMPYILINSAQAGKGVITEAVAIYFLGFLESTTRNWGKMMDTAYNFGAITNLELFYLILWPMLALALLSFALVLLAQGLDQIFNPRLRARHINSDDEDDRDTLDPANT